MGGYHKLSDKVCSSLLVLGPFLIWPLIVLPPCLPLLYTHIIPTAVLSKSYESLELFSFHLILPE